jgi:hypothetical protein
VVEVARLGRGGVAHRRVSPWAAVGNSPGRSPLRAAAAASSSG